jgi:CheY-like chemotaxis protein
LASSSVFTPVTNIQVPVLGWPFVNESSTSMMAGSGSNPNPDEDQSSASRSQSDETGGTPPQILVVEDNPADVLLIRRALRAAYAGAEIQVVSDGQQAIRTFEVLDGDYSLPRPTLVILDINLPKVPGPDVLKYLRESRRCCEVKVLVVSTSDAERDRDTMSKLGADGYFRKPSAVGEFMKLGDIVKTLLEKPN